MDKRWKAVERGMARELSKIVSGIGISPTERIPLLGREGPDLTINETKLVVNVKSRKVIPNWIFPGKYSLIATGDLLSFRVKHLLEAPRFSQTNEVKKWKQLQDWYDWMEKWTKEECVDGVSCIILHKPGMPYGNSAVVIHKSNWRLFCKTLSYYQTAGS